MAMDVELAASDRCLVCPNKEQKHVFRLSTTSPVGVLELFAEAGPLTCVIGSVTEGNIKTWIAARCTNPPCLMAKWHHEVVARMQVEKEERIRQLRGNRKRKKKKFRDRFKKAKKSNP